MVLPEPPKDPITVTIGLHFKDRRLATRGLQIDSFKS